MDSRIPAWLEELGASREESGDGDTPVPGDITIYEPWGNVAIFCRDWSQSNSLIKIGHINDNGIETFNVPGDITVRFEKQ